MFHNVKNRKKHHISLRSSIQSGIQPNIFCVYPQQTLKGHLLFIHAFNMLLAI